MPRPGGPIPCAARMANRAQLNIVVDTANVVVPVRLNVGRGFFLALAVPHRLSFPPLERVSPPDNGVARLSLTYTTVVSGANPCEVHPPGVYLLFPNCIIPIQLDADRIQVNNGSMLKGPFKFQGPVTPGPNCSG